ncbi:type IV secretion system protein TraC [Massilia sp. TS11]|uniref:type IV secretion system protein TraC n=1 Tax=Massilia sp. TS11 TaxID=2908003 RepID=UPI001ED9CFB7|nr:type IV secretion system protein TraC [Massilia sp. TS11]MCG2583887.1 type IV secretion system protein TraC [Massilia sp. TS11]
MVFGFLKSFSPEAHDAPAPDRFASWLPYRAYDAATQLFINRDGPGYVLELLPQSGADEQMVEVLVSLYATCPPGTGLQFHLFGSPDVQTHLRAYANLRREDTDQYEKSQPYGRPARNDNLYRKLARQRVGHLLRGARESLSEGFPCHVRHYRLLLSVTLDPKAGWDSDAVLALRDAMAATLTTAAFPNRVCSASDLINWCAQFVNPDRMFGAAAPLHYDEGREICDQIVDFDTIQDPHPTHLHIWKQEQGDGMQARFLSVKSYPRQFHLWQAGGLVGDLMQPALQYQAPFMITMGVHVLDPNTARNAVVANHVRANQNAQSKMAQIMPDVAEKLKDWSAAAQTIDAGGGLVYLYHQLAVFAPPDKATAAVETAKSVWRARGFELSVDVYQQRQALLASLPMTLTPKLFGDLRKMRRTTRKTTANAIHLAPLIAEWQGTGTPVLTLQGRRGQLVACDLYDNAVGGNYNFAVIGTSGSGKSVMLNEIAWSYLSTGALLRILDFGRSMEKLCRNARGTFIEVRSDVPICFNPFPRVGLIEDDIEILEPTIALMCSPKAELSDVQRKAIAVMILNLWRAHGKDMTITAMRDAFVEGSLPELGLKQDQRIKDLAIMLAPFSKGGQYERFFEGANTVNFDNELVVIENEELSRKPALRPVLNSLLLYQITGEMYLSRNRKKVFIIDEVKQQLDTGGTDDPYLSAVIDAAARRTRKYGGALGTATQNAEDYYSSTQLESALNCADWVFLLRQKPESIEALQAKKRLVMDEPKKRLLNSLRTEPGVFSEMYISSPIGEGLARLALDPATHLLFSNRLEDNRVLDELRARGLSIDEAIDMVLQARGQA